MILDCTPCKILQALGIAKDTHQFPNISYDEKPSLLPLEALFATVKVKSLKGQYLILPKAANVSAIPEPVKVIVMESFGFVDGKLVWLTKKKNAKHYSQPEKPAKAGSAGPACESHTA